MGKFIISRSAAGDSFRLLADNGRTLAVSRHYATLDACKKGIASLIVNAPVIPVLDATVGDYGPNPKFEIVAAERGFAFLMKSANGKSVITSPAYATKKACLRAIAMLRSGVGDYELLFHTKEGLTPLTMKAPAGAMAKPAAVSVPTALPTDEPPTPLFELDELPVPDVTELAEPALHDVAEAPTEGNPAPDTAKAPGEGAPAAAATEAQSQVAAPKPLTPRLIRLQPDKAPREAREAPVPTPQKTSKGRAEKPPKRRGFLGKLFKK